MIYIVLDNNPDAIEAVRKITSAKDGDVVYLTQHEMDAYNDINFVKVIDSGKKRK